MLQTVGVEKRGVSIPELAKEYGVSTSHLYRLANKGELRGCVRLGQRFVIDRSEFQKSFGIGLDN